MKGKHSSNDCTTENKQKYNYNSDITHTMCQLTTNHRISAGNPRHNNHSPAYEVGLLIK